MSSGVAAVDIFCGVGGLSHGLAKANISIVGGVDIDESCRYAFEYNNRARFICSDVTMLSPETVAQLYPKGSVRVLVGCAPCQPFSSHTQKIKNRHEDARWCLLSSFSSLVRKVEPEIVSMENVPQLAKEQVFLKFVRNLERLNYFVTTQIVTCSDYGVPQKRKRLVLLASRFGEIRLRSPRQKRKLRTVRDAIGKLPKLKAGERAREDIIHSAAALSALNLERIKNSQPGGSWKDWNVDLRSECHKKISGKKYSSVYSRMEWDDLGPTITTQFFTFGTGRFGHPEQDRAISLREGALLQTFPKSYRFVHPDEDYSFVAIGRHIGNAVPVKLGVAIGKTISEHIANYR
jgi:DNA (cytosine-5)-methyltransferase 1